MSGNYDVILGRDILRELGITLDFQKEAVNWNNATIKIRFADCTQEMFYMLKDNGHAAEVAERIYKILDAKYTPVNLDDIVKGNQKLSTNQRQKLLKLLTNHETLFDGSLGKWEGDPCHIELCEGVKPYHAHPYGIPYAYKSMLLMEVE